MTLRVAPENHPLVTRIRSAYPQVVLSAHLFREELTIEAAAAAGRAILELLKTDPELAYVFLADLTCVDRYPVEPRFEIIYHLLSLKTRTRLRLKVHVPGENPRLDSVTGFWPAANWLEREVFDLFGVQFAGHPNLRRLLMPDDWEGHPLRKDYPVEGPR
ncbi:MAG: NADH-quinone oxidoreductase subunit C [Acidobacteria bacterium]|nr:NADH-quinone oxidoreductase subunit C [Acidobacteriota bacterium]